MKVVKCKKLEKIINFDALNTFHPPMHVGKNQATDLRNVDSSRFPALKVRNGKTVVGTTIATPNALGQRNNEYIHVVDGSIWKYWNGSAFVNVQTGLVSGPGEFKEFSTGASKSIIFSNGIDRNSWDGTTMTLLSASPNSNIFATHKGRVYWARASDIVYSALNLVNDYSGAGSGTLNVTRAKGVIVGLVEFSDRVWVFTAYGMHGLYGTGPDNFELIDPEGNIGCASKLSIVVVNKQLYWYSYDGIYEFDGSTPMKVSEPYTSKFGSNGVDGGCTTFIKGIKASLRVLVASGSIGDYLFVSIPYGASATKNNLTLMFDTKLRKWYVRSEGFIYFVTVDNILYGVDSNGVLWDMSTSNALDGTTPISWYFITGALNGGTPSSRETINEVWLTFNLPIGSTMQIAYSEDDEGTSFIDSPYVFTPSAKTQTARVQLPNTALQDTNYRRWKIYGTGDCTIYNYEEKGRDRMNPIGAHIESDTLGSRSEYTK